MGEPDGKLGPRTRQALIEFQWQQGFQATGQIDTQTDAALGVSNLSGQRGNQGGSRLPIRVWELDRMDHS